MKKAPRGAPDAEWVQLKSGSEDLGFGVANTSELGLLQPLGLEDLLADQDEGMHDAPPRRQPRSLLPGLASLKGMNVVQP